jgi:hypothetical protein
MKLTPDMVWEKAYEMGCRDILIFLSTIFATTTSVVVLRVCMKDYFHYIVLNIAFFVLAYISCAINCLLINYVGKRKYLYSIISVLSGILCVATIGFLSRKLIVVTSSQLQTIYSMTYCLAMSVIMVVHTYFLCVQPTQIELNMAKYALENGDDF